MPHHRHIVGMRRSIDCCRFYIQTIEVIHEKSWLETHHLIDDHYSHDQSNYHSNCYSTFWSILHETLTKSWSVCIPFVSNDNSFLFEYITSKNNIAIYNTVDTYLYLFFYFSFLLLTEFHLADEFIGVWIRFYCSLFSWHLYENFIGGLHLISKRERKT